jgi:hypothetical protein
MRNANTDPIKTVLTITIGFVIIFIFTEWKWFLYVSAGIGLAGVFSSWLSGRIHFAWIKLGLVISKIVNLVILGAFFYLFLYPISLLSKLFGSRDHLMLKNRHQSTFTESNKKFDKSGFERTW